MNLKLIKFKLLLFLVIILSKNSFGFEIPENFINYPLVNYNNFDDLHKAKENKDFIDFFINIFSEIISLKEDHNIKYNDINQLLSIMSVWIDRDKYNAEIHVAELLLTALDLHVEANLNSGLNVEEKSKLNKTMFNLCGKMLNTKHIEALTPEILTLTLSFEIEPDQLMLKNILKLRGKLKNYMGLNDKSYMKLVDKKLAEYGVLIDEEEK